MSIVPEKTPGKIQLINDLSYSKDNSTNEYFLEYKFFSSILS